MVVEFGLLCLATDAGGDGKKLQMFALLFCSMMTAGSKQQYQAKQFFSCLFSLMGADDGGKRNQMPASFSAARGRAGERKQAESNSCFHFLGDGGKEQKQAKSNSHLFWTRGKRRATAESGTKFPLLFSRKRRQVRGAGDGSKPNQTPACFSAASGRQRVTKTSRIKWSLIFSRRRQVGSGGRRG